MNEVTPALAILSSMITPAVLILASGSLIMTTSQRLSRVIERVRKIAQEFAQMEKNNEADEKQRTILYDLLRKSARRSLLLTRAMTFLYLSLGLFVATSLMIGVIGVTHARFTWIPTALGMMGAGFLFVSSSILVIESRLTLHVVSDELEFVIESTKEHAPESVRKAVKAQWRKWIGFK